MPDNKKIAIVGYAFRLPGLLSQDPQTFWQALCAGENLVTEVDGTRWNKSSFLHPEKNNPGTSYTFAAGSIGDVSRFDAEFFGISPREAGQMDPQQRLLLELSWEALENAGIPPFSLRGTRSGVFVGISSTDYAYRRADDLAALDASTMTGNTASIAANRISYFFDLRGPSMAVDTACSSSLVAFHQACQSIRAGEAGLTIVGGVSLLLHPFGFIGFSKASMLSRRGICNAFDAAGDGYVRAEGAGIFVLKNYAQALADGDRIVALVAGSGVNCDGKTNGITVPSSEAQAALLEEVYAKAGIAPDDIDYIEAHGTGTAVGDPIETRAIASALASRRGVKPLPIGSVKSNIGHLEAASGAAGLVKALLCLQHRAIPATIHLDTPNPNIKFGEWNLEPVTALARLAGDKPLTIGINSFGFGGANAHVVLQSAPAALSDPGASAKDVEPDQPFPNHFFLSARNEAALRASAMLHAEWLKQHSEIPVSVVAHSLLTRRDLMEQRLVACARDRQALVERLQIFAERGFAEGIESGGALPAAGNPVFVYSGNGSQWVGMGRALLATHPKFREALNKVDVLFRRYCNRGITAQIEQLTEAQLAHTEIAQPALFALQVGLTTLLLDAGIRPAAVVGHSVGEVAAAWACGALSLEQAVRVIHHRSTEQGKTRGMGKMTAASMSRDEAAGLIAKLALADAVCIAGINSHKGITLAGEMEGLDRIEAALHAKNLFCKRLDLDYAFHSPAMDPIRDSVETLLADLRPGQTTIPFVSTVTGGKLEGERLDAAYWWRNIREPVQFAPALETLIDEGKRIFVEIGPHPVLRGYLKDCLQTGKYDGRVIPLMGKTEAGADNVDAAVRKILVSGIDLPVAHSFPAPAAPADLPNYPWQKETHWHPTTEESYRLLQRHKEHPLLGYRLSENTWQWENHIDLALYPHYRDHAVGDAVVMPAAGFIEMALAACALWRPRLTSRLENLEIHVPLLLDEKHAKTVRFAIDTSDGSFTIKSRDRLSQELWLTNATGRLLQGGPLDAAPQLAREVTVGELVASGEEHYRLAGSLGLAYGPAFRAVRAVFATSNGFSAEMTAPDCLATEIAGYLLHPALLDGCFQLLVNLLPRAGHAGHAFIPVRMGQVSLYQSHCSVQRGSVAFTRCSSRSLVADCRLFAADGSLVAKIDSARFQRIDLKHARATRLKQLVLAAVPRPGPHQAALAALPTPLSPLLDRAFESKPMPALLTTYHEEVEPLLDVICDAYLAEGLKKLSGGNQPIVIDDLLAQGKVRFGRQSQLKEILALLQEDGLLRETDAGWCWVEDETLAEAWPTWLTLIEDYPDFASRIIAVGHIGENIEAILAGHCLPIDLIPALARIDAFNLHTADTDFRVIDIIRDTVVHVAQTLPAAQRLRILEVSKQNSRLAHVVLGRIDRDQCDYVCAIHAEAFSEVKRNLGDVLSGVEYHAWSSSGLELPDERKFDLIVIPDGLTGIEGKTKFLGILRSRLAAGGELLLLEQTPSRWSSLLQLGAKPEQHYQIPYAWDALLSAAGYGQIRMREDNPHSKIGAVLFSARNEQSEDLLPANAVGHCWLLVAPPGAARNDASDAALASLRRQFAAHSATLIEVWPQDARAATAPAGHVYAMDDDTGMNTLFAALEIENGRISGVMLAAALRGEDRDSPEAALCHQETQADLALRLMRAIDGLQSKPDMVLVTAQVHGHLTGQPVNPRDASLWGLGRTMINEAAGYRVRLIDLAESAWHDKLAAALVDDLLFPDDEDEIVLCAQGRRALRIRDRNAKCGHAAPEDAPRVRLDFATPGQLKNLRWIGEAKPLPGPGEVAIDVRAAGLNFRDVMFVMGLLSDEAVEQGFAGAMLGMELSGVIRSVGPGVSRLLPGMEVMAFAPASFSNYVITAASAVINKPSHWSFEATATVPTTFFTAYYALHHLARLQPGEKILIHGAAGGVGIAAIRIAQYLGAEIFATAGTEEKRHFVRRLGIEHVMDSRSLDFADQILERTAGRGVDAVLNSLAGEAINQNLRVLRPFGRFLELGKRDFYENTRIGLRPFRNNISYFGIDADQLMAEHPELTEQLLRELMALFESGHLKPLPYRAFAVTEIVEAFRYMQQSRQIGKVVVSFRDGLPTPGQASEEAPAPPIVLPAQASYLVSGGLSGFGLATARWLAERGARHLVLTSRRGAATAEAEIALRELSAAGVNVIAFTGDIALRGDVADLFASIEAQMPPLRGIVHAAAVIDDGLLRNLGRASIDRVFAPKILGANHLDEFSRKHPLDFFILYSSATTLFGNPGQGNYVAANHYLEALAARRRQQGLPALAVCWGPIGDVGFLSRNQKIKESLVSHMGGAALCSTAALATLDQLLALDHPAVGVLNFDWAALARFLPSARSPKFREIAHGQDPVAAQDNSAELQRWLRELPHQDLHAAMLELLKSEVGEILGIAPEKIAADKSVYDMGMDSLMAVELITAVDHRFGIHLPVMALSESPTIARLAERIILQLKGGEAEPGTEAARLADNVRAIAQQHGSNMDAGMIDRIGDHLTRPAS